MEKIKKVILVSGSTIAITFMIAVVLILYSNIINAEEFKSITAKVAQEKYEKAIAKAKADYIKELEIALERAYKANSMDEANLIGDELIKLKGGEVKEEPVKEKLKVETKQQKANRLAIIGTWKAGLSTTIIKDDGTFINTTVEVPGTWELIDDSGAFKMKYSDSGVTVICQKPVEGKFKDSRGIEFVKQKDKK